MDDKPFPWETEPEPAFLQRILEVFSNDERSSMQVVVVRELICERLDPTFAAFNRMPSSWSDARAKVRERVESGECQFGVRAGADD